MFWFVNLFSHNQLTHFRGNKSDSKVKVVPFCFYLPGFFFSSQILYISQTYMWPHFYEAQVLLQTNQSFMDLQGRTTFIFPVWIHEPLMFCEKCAIIDSLLFFFLFFNFYCQVVPCACCSLTGFFSHLKKSSKSEHKAFAFKQSKIRFCLCLIHHISCMSMFGTGQKYEIPHGKLCLPSNCYLNASCSLIVENTL